MENYNFSSLFSLLDLKLPLRVPRPLIYMKPAILRRNQSTFDQLWDHLGLESFQVPTIEHNKCTNLIIKHHKEEEGVEMDEERANGTSRLQFNWRMLKFPNVQELKTNMISNSKFIHGAQNMCQVQCWNGAILFFCCIQYQFWYIDTHIYENFKNQEGYITIIDGGTNNSLLVWWPNWYQQQCFFSNQICLFIFST